MCHASVPFLADGSQRREIVGGGGAIVGTTEPGWLLASSPWASMFLAVSGAMPRERLL